MNKILFIFIIVTTQSLATTQKWYVTDPNGFDFYLTTEINNKKIIGYTRKNALKNIVGWAKFTLVKLTSSMKYPEIIYLNGEITEGNISGVIQNLFSKRNFEGTMNANFLTLRVQQKNGKLFELKGQKVNEFLARRNYENIYQKIFKLTEENLFRPSFFQTKQWNKFKQKMLDLSKKMKDDLEMQIAFFALAREFPFSHYQLNPKINNRKSNIQPNFAKLIEINKQTVVLDIDSFTGTKEQMLLLLKKITDTEYKNLIVDLRNNYGGNFLSAYPLGQFLLNKPFIAGVFPNQKWYKLNDRVPTVDEYSKFNEFSSGTMQEWMEKASSKYGIYLKIYPTSNHYTGKVYVLTNRYTASTCEPLVYALKHEKIATIIGENTRGAMLSMNSFTVEDNIKLGIPVNDYITYTGERIDKIGITPDIKINSENALDAVLDLIDSHTK